MKWEIPPIIKIYEALGAIADKRIDVIKPEGRLNDLNKVIRAKVYSSSKGKYYDVEYDETKNAIMTNDNGSYWKGYLGYPAITLLLILGKLPLNEDYSSGLKDIMRKDINTENNNDFDKTIQEIDEIMINKGINLDKFNSYLLELEKLIVKMDLEMLGEKKIPPKGY